MSRTRTRSGTAGRGGTNRRGGTFRRWRGGWLAAAVALGAALQGCSCGEAPVQVGAAPRPATEALAVPASPVAAQPVTGRVSATAPGVTRRGLAGAEVLFLTEEAMRPFLAARVAAAEAELKALGSELGEARARRSAALAEADRTNQAWKATNDNDLRRRLEVQFKMRRDPKGVQAVHQSLLSEKQEAWALAVAAAKRSEEAERALTSVAQRAQRAREGDFYLEGLPAPLVTARTGADGTFAASLPPGGYGVVATVERGRGHGSELGVWLLWARVEPGAGLLLDLDERNLHGSDCRDCAVAVKALGATSGAAVRSVGQP